MGIIIRIRSNATISLILILVISLLVTPLTALGVVIIAGPPASSVSGTLSNTTLTSGNTISFQATVKDNVGNAVYDLLPTAFTYYLGPSAAQNVTNAVYQPGGFYNITAFVPNFSVSSVPMAVYANNTLIGGFANVSIGGGGAGTPAITFFAVNVPTVGQYTGTIDNAAGTINIEVPVGTDRGNLMAGFQFTGSSVTVGGQAQTPGQPKNFTNPVQYTVTTASGATKVYTVTVSTSANATGTPRPGAGTLTAEQAQAIVNNIMRPIGMRSDGKVPMGLDLMLVNGLLEDSTWTVTWALTSGDALTKIANDVNASDPVYTQIARPQHTGTATLTATVSKGGTTFTKAFVITVIDAPTGMTAAQLAQSSSIASQLASATSFSEMQNAMSSAATQLSTGLEAALAANNIPTMISLMQNNAQQVLSELAKQAASSAEAKNLLINTAATNMLTINRDILAGMGRGVVVADLSSQAGLINDMIQQTIVGGSLTPSDISSDLKSGLATSIMKIIDTAGTCKPAGATIAAADLTSAINEVNTQFTSFNSKLNTFGGAGAIGTTTMPVERRVNLFMPTGSSAVTLDSSAINAVIGQASNQMKLAVTRQVTVGATTVPVAAKIPAALINSLSSTIGNSLSVEIAPNTTLTPPATVTNASSIFSFKMNNGAVSDFTYAPVTVEMPYSGSGSTLKAYYYNTGNSTWTPVTDTSGNQVAVTTTADGTVTFDTTHFTDFMVAEAASNSSGSSSSSSGSATTTTPSVTASLGTPVSVTATSGASISGSGVSIAIPAGAVASDIKVTITKVADTAALSVPSTSQLVSDVLEIVKDKSGDFSKAVTISLNFDKSKVDTSKVDVVVCFFDESKKAWVKLDNVKVDASSGKVSGDVTHFTKFAVLTFPKAAATPTPTPEATPTTPANAGPNDIEGHWAQAGIARLVAKGIIKGYPDGSFKPNNAITRVEFAVILVKALGGSPQAGKTFNDTAAHWAKDYISTAVAMGIVSGYSNTQFAPDEQITREQMAQMVVNAAKLAKSSAKLTFKDAAGISSWAKVAVASIKAAGIMSGYPDNTFKAKANATRAEAVTVVTKIMK